MMLLFVELKLISGYKNKWRGQDIVKLITQFYLVRLKEKKEKV